jgi:hypothetical protein
MKQLITRQEIRQMVRVAERGKWVGLVRLADIPAFAQWLSDDRHEWMLQSPDVGEVLRAYKPGRPVLIVRYDGRHTVCGRAVMALWHTFCGFRED